MPLADAEERLTGRPSLVARAMARSSAVTDVHPVGRRAGARDGLLLSGPARLRRPNPSPRVSVPPPSVAEGGTTRVVAHLDRAAARPLKSGSTPAPTGPRPGATTRPCTRWSTIPAGRPGSSSRWRPSPTGWTRPTSPSGCGSPTRVHAVLDDDSTTVDVPRRATRVPGVAPQDAASRTGAGHRLGFTEVRLSAPSGRRVVVSLATRPGSAGSGDFVPLHPTVVFAPGETSHLVSVEVLSDNVVEGPETVRLVVESAWHARPTRRATITIVDADCAHRPFGQDGPVTRALVRRPGPRLAEGLLTHLDRVPVDVELALRQWEAYVAALRGDGWETVEVPPADDCPDAVFVEDTVVDVRRPRRRHPARVPTSASRRRPAPRRRCARSATGSRASRRPAPSTAATCSSTAARCGSGSAAGPTPAGVDQLGAHLAPLGARGAPGAGEQGAAPEVGGHRPARRHRRRLPAARRRPGASGRRSCPSPRSRAPTSCCSTTATVLMSASAPRSRGAASRSAACAVVPVDITRVREARGLRDLPVGAAALTSRTEVSRGRCRRCARGGRRDQPGVEEPVEVLARRPARPAPGTPRWCRCRPRGRRPRCAAIVQNAASPTRCRSACSVIAPRCVDRPVEDARRGPGSPIGERPERVLVRRTRSHVVLEPLLRVLAAVRLGVRAPP